MDSITKINAFKVKKNISKKKYLSNFIKHTIYCIINIRIMYGSFSIVEQVDTCKKTPYN